VSGRPEFRFVAARVAECLELRDKHGRLADIRVGAIDGRWFHALSFQQRGGDCWGAASPLGYSTIQPEPRGVDTQTEALAAAIAEARRRWAGREREMAPHFAWLDTLIPDQLDLFGAAA
jgi:hypothetical protein